MNEYQRKSSGTFKDATPITSDNQIHLLDWCLGLGGETGEVLDLVKHSIFHQEPLDRMEIAKELGDVLWYLSAICTTLHISMDDVAKLNLAKLQHRYNQGYSNEDSANRHSKELALKDTPEYKILMGRIKADDVPVNIIVIGPDGAGKTTLIKRLSERLHMDVVKCDYKTEDKVAAAKEYLDTNIDVIYDRFFYPDDVVYSVVKGQTPPSYAKIERLFTQRNPIILYVFAPLDVLEERSKAWADDYVSVDELTKIIGEYEEALDALSYVTPILRINNTAPVDSDDYNTQLTTIEKFIQRCKDIYAEYPSYGDYLRNKGIDYE